ncbi:hypothetical protein [Streptomyces sp. NPDC046939]|uniref:hypothetical protein n=1 Tax=Streptomyces sp. NPDC046939 TaxID=3155376 RepID=UPI0033C1400A
MSHSTTYPLPPLADAVVLVVDATAGVGRRIATQLCAAGAAVAVVGAGHPGRADDAATNAAFLCKELADIGLVALPYQVDTERAETFRALPGQIAADLGTATACVVVIPAGDAAESLPAAMRVVAGAVAAALPPSATYVEVEAVEDMEGQERLVQEVMGRLAARNSSRPRC